MHWREHFSFTLAKQIRNTLNEIQPYWDAVDQLVAENQLRVLQAFRAEKLGEEDFQDSSGYGYHDRGREKLESVFARTFRAEAALVRPQLVSGTHALAVALFAVLRPGDTLLSLTGPPYDTLQAVIGSKGEEEGTLKEWGIKYMFVPPGEDGYPSISALTNAGEPKVVYIQKSAGYDLQRRTLTVPRLRNLIETVKKRWPDTLVMVDNCYGEFVEIAEPVEAGADLVVGSLIKNPGGGLAPGGGYMVGRKTLIQKAFARLTAPGLYGQLGAFKEKRSLFQGFFHAPALVGNGLKNAIFAAALFKKIGFAVYPEPAEERGDIVQAIILKDPELVVRFCQAVQAASPVGSYLTLEPAPMPGYSVPVIMAAGTFNQGASSELTADAPMREPYAVFLQGGLTLPHALWATSKAAEAVIK